MKFIQTCGLLFTLCVFFISAVEAQVSIYQKSETGEDTIASIDKIFKDYNDINKPGAAVAVVRDGRVVFKKGYGSANMEYDVPVDPSTVFHIASVSKQFTVFAILLLEAEGKLSFDDDIRKHIPEVPDFGTTITLRHLAAHTSGMRDQWDLLSMAGWRMDDVITKDHIMTMVKHQKELNFQPGEEYSYCNTGFTLLAEVVARVSGVSFATFTKNKIFSPLRMENTLFYDDHEKIVKNRAYSYKMPGNKYMKSRLNFSNAGATSLFTTVEDLALWAMNFENPKVGSQAIIDKMSTLAVLNNGETFGGAYGQFIGSHKGHPMVQHGGADAGYRSYFVRFPDDKFAVMVFSNYANSNTSKLAYEVADLFLKDETPAEDKGEKSNYVSVSAEHLKQFEAHFWNEGSALARRIYIKNDTLHYFRSDYNETKLLPISFNKFEMKDVPQRVTVEFIKKDNKLSMKVEQADGNVYDFEEYKPVDLASFDLDQYAGTFYSEEIDTEYEIFVRRGMIVGRHFRLGEFPFTFVKEDVLQSPGGLARVVRNESGEITGIKASTGRVRNLWFEKK